MAESWSRNFPATRPSFSGGSTLLIEGAGKTGAEEYQPPVRKRISELEEEIRVLKNYHNGASLTCRLPVELLSTIFSAVARFSTDELIRATHVCKHWRSVALDCPGLWTELGTSTFLKEGLAEAMLFRSKQAPLTAAYDRDQNAHPTQPPVAIRAISNALTHISRLKSVDLSNANDDKVILPSMLSEWTDAYATILERLCLVNLVHGDFYLNGTFLPSMVELEESQLQGGFLAGGAPRLSHLELSHLGLAWEGLPLGANIRRLKLLEDTRYGSRFRPTASAFLISLAAMPRLESLELHGLIPVKDVAAFTRGFTLTPTLKSLCLTDLSNSLAYFFQIAQVLEHVSMEITFFQEEGDDSSAIQEVLERLNPASGVRRANTSVYGLRDMWASTTFHLTFSRDGKEGRNVPYPSRGSDNSSIGCLKLNFVRGPAVAFEPQEYYTILSQQFDLSSLHSLVFEQTDTEDLGEGVWSYLGLLQNVERIRFSRSQLLPFLKHHKRHPNCFPALKTIQGASTLDFDIWRSEDAKQEYVQCLAEMCTARK